MKDLELKRQQEKEMVTEMIALFCHKKHHTKRGQMCPDCRALSDYACLRSDKCPFMETKTFCSNCKVHCYKPEMRQKIKEVMRFSGPRIMFSHPISATRHVFLTLKEKKRLAKESRASSNEGKKASVEKERA